MNDHYTIHQGDALAVLKTMPDESVQCCVTSPPYWGLRDYGHDGQMGLEPTPDEYVAGMVALFREVRRVLKDDGVLWLNLGDSYASNPSSGGTQSSKMTGGEHKRTPRRDYIRPDGLKPKDLVGIPWRVAFALQADGWWLRSDVIWAKPNPMPESVRDRPTRAHEYVFLLTKAARYFWDADSVSTKTITGGRKNLGMPKQRARAMGRKASGNEIDGGKDKIRGLTKNIRTVWTITPQPTPDAHFATFPEALPERCIKAASRKGDTVLDPFTGSGTTGRVALRLGRKFAGIELNPEYVALAHERIQEVNTGVSRKEAKQGQRGLFTS